MGYNKLANIYDTLAYMVFGGSIKKSQIHFLDQIQKNSKILIVGGTGWILNELDQLGLQLNITYLDSASEMIKKSKKRSPFKHISVVFMTGSVNMVSSKHSVIITNFFLDVFDERSLTNVMQY